jgi:hypothetical protein
MLEKCCVENNNDNDHSLGLKAVLPWGCAEAALYGRVDGTFPNIIFPKPKFPTH